MKQQWQQTIHTRSPSMNFMPTFRAENPHNSVLRTEVNHSLKQRTNTSISHAGHSPLIAYIKKLVYSKINNIISPLILFTLKIKA